MINHLMMNGFLFSWMTGKSLFALPDTPYLEEVEDACHQVVRLIMYSALA
jgi:hypothetical protein